MFAPLENLGLVVVDEEHDGSYKQDISPRYNGRDVAIRRARGIGRGAGARQRDSERRELLAGASRASIQLLTMASRVENRPMPTVHIADLREEYAKGRAHDLQRACSEQAIRDRLERGEQVILLQNRRAYSTFLLCRDCGFVARCPNCAVSLKFHSGRRS